MATATDLMALGMSPYLAAHVSNTPSAFTASGASQASAAQWSFQTPLIFVNASNSGSGVKLPAVGGQSGCLLGDDGNLLNLLSATIQVYTASTGTIYLTGVSATGSTGVGIDPGFSAIFQPITVSSWLCVKASA